MLCKTYTHNISKPYQEWESLNGFESFFSSKEFEVFISIAGPLLAESPQPQLFETNLPLRHLTLSTVTEIVRLPMDLHSTQDSAWAQLVTAIEAQSGQEHHAICGQSVNLDEKLWLGIISWESTEVGTNIRADI